MHLVRQETKNSCGAGVVAMVAGITWDEAVKALGTRGCTNYSHLIRALDKLGVHHGDMVRVRKGAELPESCIVRLNWRNGSSHWIVWQYGLCWDPADGRRLPEDYGTWWNPTSYMAVVPKSTSAGASQHGTAPLSIETHLFEKGDSHGSDSVDSR